VRAGWLAPSEYEHILAALMPQNRLALEVSACTGLRISDVLNLRTLQLQQHPDGRLTIRELKTGKTRRIRLPVELYRRMLANAGKVWVWECRTDWRKHRTRQAVFKDIRRTAKLFRCPVHVSPHTSRKVYAVAEYHRTGSLKAVQRLLQHDSEAVTMLYAMADVLEQRKHGHQSQTP
jgi:integrase